MDKHKFKVFLSGFSPWIILGAVLVMLPMVVDARHSVVMAMVLLLVGCVGVLLLFLFHFSLFDAKLFTIAR